MMTLYNIQNQNIRIQDGHLSIDAVSLDNNTLYVCCPYGIGDTLYVAALINSYKSYYSLDKKICLIVKRSHSFIPDCFETIDKKIASDDLVSLLNAFSISTQTWKLKNYLYGHFKKNEHYKLYSEYYTISDKCMVSRYKELVFGIPATTTLNVPNYQNLSTVQTHALDKNSVILMPYAMSTPLLPTIFWETLANILNHLGYNLYTNVKDSSETAITGTLPISCTLKEMILISEQCLATISLRSGICDLLAYTNAILIVINTDEQIFEEWDLTKIHNRDGIANLLCTNLQDLSSLTKEILYIFGIFI